MSDVDGVLVPLLDLLRRVWGHEFVTVCMLRGPDTELPATLMHSMHNEAW